MCTGACCAAFPISCTHEHLIEHRDTITDGAQLAAMLIPIDSATALTRLLEADAPHALALIASVRGRAGELFTCRHWNPATRLCGAYAGRPLMCSSYPNGQPCEHCGDPPPSP